MQIKVFFYLDFDAFFASVEELKHPEFTNIPLVVGGNSSNSVVCSANYIARSYGVHAAMPYFQAQKLLPPNAVYIKSDLNLYERISKKIFAYIKHHYSNVINIYSIDECWFSLNLSQNNWASVALSKARLIQDDILNAFKLSISIGIGLSLFLSKMASNLKKPLGISIIKDQEDVKKKIWPLKIQKMFMVGKSLTKKLNSINIFTIKDLANYKNYEILKKILNKNYLEYIQNANGIIANIEISHEKPKSFSIKRTLPSPMSTGVELFNLLNNMAKELAHCLYNARAKVKKITCIVESHKNKEYVAYMKYVDPVYLYETLNNEFLKLFDSLFLPNTFLIRSIGFNLTNVIYEELDNQLKLSDLQKMDSKTKTNINWQAKVISLINQTSQQNVAKVSNEIIETKKMHFRH